MRPSNLSFSGRAHGRFRAAVSAAKNPVPGADKVWWREFRLEAVAAGCALGLKSVNVAAIWPRCRTRIFRQRHECSQTAGLAFPLLTCKHVGTRTMRKRKALIFA